MVLLTTTPAAHTAVQEYCSLSEEWDEVEAGEVEERLWKLLQVEIESPIDHSDLVDISKFLVKRVRQNDGNAIATKWRLDTLLKGSIVYQPPPPSKTEPASFAYQIFSK